MPFPIEVVRPVRSNASKTPCFSIYERLKQSEIIRAKTKNSMCSSAAYFIRQNEDRAFVRPATNDKRKPILN